MSEEPVKTWEYVPNIVHSGASLLLRNQLLWLALKDALTGALPTVDALGVATTMTLPFRIIASSNGVVADASDNWNSISDLVSDAPGSSHSWIHLQQAGYFGIGDHLNLLLAIEDELNYQIGYVAWARGALGWNNDGTATNRPTPEAGVAVIVARDGTATGGTAQTADQMWGSNTINDQVVIQMRISDDGQAGGFWVFQDSECVAFHGWQRDQLSVPSAGHTEDFWVWSAALNSNAEINVWSSTWNTVPLLWTVDNGGTPVLGNVTVPAHSTFEVPAVRDNTGLSPMLFPAYIIEPLTSRCYGVLTDTWWGSDANVSGDGSPIGPLSGVVRRQIGDQVIPWAQGVAFQVS